MKVEQRTWTKASGWIPEQSGQFAALSQLILAFGATAVLQQPQLISTIRNDYPAAYIFGCSTAGEICGTKVSDDSLVLTAVHFEHTQILSVEADLANIADSFQAGELLARDLPRSVPDAAGGAAQTLVHVLTLTDGLKVNGSEFVAGLTRHLPEGVAVTGGLAGDGARFGETLVFRSNAPEKDTVVALGLYGSRLKVGFGSLGGWDSFGPDRLITKSTGNVLYELDGHSALALHKQYLGEHAKGLPATGLLFPLSIRTKAGETPVVRTILSIDEQAQSMTFAGDVPEGAYARLMKANFDRLIDGATGAAQASLGTIGARTPDLALLISCVGRKLVLKQRIEEEVDAVSEVLGDGAVLAGFYSYGEISPFTPSSRCELHNQTMTITTLTE